jgi:hypothetical protein
MLFLQCIIYGQVTSYQVTNNGFELWETFNYNGQSVTEPVQWNGFKTGIAPEGSLLAMAMAMLPIQFAACADVRPGSSGIKSIKTWGLDLSWYQPNLVANGLFTTGQVHLSSASYTDTNNYYGTLTGNSAFRQPLTAMPDSIYFWAKYKTPIDTQNAAIRVYIHDNSNVHDPIPASMHDNIVASILYNWPRSNQQWQQHKVAFNYASWTNQNPAYILISFFTSPIWGVGTPYDTLYVDDIELIYNRLLSDLQVDGTTVAAFNSQVAHYSVQLCQPLTVENIPVITATAASPHATVSITQPTLENLNATIVVTHGGNSKTYTVNFNSNGTFSEQNAQLCQGYSYNGYGFNIPNPATQQYSRTIQGGNIFGCDSTIYLNLTVFPAYTGAQAITKYDTICQGAGYSGYGFNLTSTQTNTTGTITRTRNNLTANGCDSTTHLSLYITPKHNTQISDRVCQGMAYQQHGFNIPATLLQHVGNHTATLNLINSFGCDSTVTLQLAIDSIYHTVLYDQICYGNPYAGYGFNLPDNLTVGTHTYEHLLSSKKGCDSLVSLYLTVNPVKTTAFCDTICQHNDYQQHGFHFSAAQTAQAGLLFDTLFLHTTQGCDSTVTLQLLVNPEYYPAPLSVKLCGSAVYDFYGQILNSTGSYTHTLTSQHGCDSVISLVLEINPEYQTLFTDSICKEEPYNQHGFTLSAAETEQAGLLHDTLFLHSMHNCDSIVMLNLTIHPSYSGVQAIIKYDTICQGAEYNSYGFTLSSAETNTAGTINRTLNLHTSNDCDSTVILNLLINPVKHTHIYDSICANSDYQQYGFNVHATGNGTILQTQSLQTVNQCDSNVTLHLFVYPEYHPAPLYFKLCGSSVYNFYGQLLDTYGNYSHTLTSKNGCDSVISLLLETGSEFRNVIPASICAGETYNQHGFSKATPGLDSITYSANNGCDSVVVLNLTVHPSYSGAQAITQYDTICQGEGYNRYNFILTDAETNTVGAISRTHSSLLTVNGCDSVVHLALYVKPKQSISIYDTVCQGEDYQLHGFNIPADTLQSVENYTTTLNLTNSLGCDSLITLHLTIHPVKTTVFNDKTCLNSEYQKYGFNFLATETAQAGMLSDTLFLNTIYGCDSTVILNLTIHPLYADTLTVNICDNYFWEDTNYTTGGAYFRYYQSEYGCDSIKILQLTLYYTSSITHFNDTVRGGYTYNNHGFTIAAPQVSNDILDTLRLFNATGCDSTVTLRLHVIPMQYDTVHNYYCQGDSYLWKGFPYSEPHSFTDTLFEANATRIITTHFIENEAPVHQFSISDCNPYLWSDSVYNATGSYTRIYLLPTGCDSTVTLHFTRFTAYSFEENDTICENEDVVYEWHGQQLTESGIYWDSLTTTNGCDSVYKLQLTVYPSYFIDYQRTFCNNNTYSWRGQSITESGIYWDSLTTVHGCDSLYRCEAVVNLTYLTAMDTTICETETLTWQGQIYSASGNYTTTYSTVAGCDSIYKLNLTVLPIITLDSNRTICEGESIIWGDEVADTTGIYTKYLTNRWHCDTVCLLHLTVNPVNQTDLSYTSAIGDTLDYEGFTLSGDTMEEAGEYTLERILINQYGCDSIVRLQLTVSGIAEAETHNIRIYPNPASNRFTIENEQGALKNITIYDLTGRLMKQLPTINSNKVSIPVNHWSKGIYIIKIDIGEAVLIRKIVIN